MGRHLQVLTRLSFWGTTTMSWWSLLKTFVRSERNWTVRFWRTMDPRAVFMTSKMLMARYGLTKGRASFSIIFTCFCCGMTSTETSQDRVHYFGRWAESCYGQRDPSCPWYLMFLRHRFVLHGSLSMLHCYAYSYEPFLCPRPFRELCVCSILWRQRERRKRERELSVVLATALLLHHKICQWCSRWPLLDGL